MQSLWQDLRYSIRTSRKNLGFTIVAAVTLALGIGANTAIFQLLDAVRLKALPVKNPQELAEVKIADMTGARGNFNSWNPSVTNFIWEQIRDRQEAFSGIFAWSPDSFNLSTGGEVRAAQALWVSGDFFATLDVKPVLGRVFTSTDDQRGCGAAGAVISYSFWQREFGGNPNVIGKTLSLDYQPVEIIGVTQPGFFGLEIGKSFDVAMPICAEAAIRGANNRLDADTTWWLTVMGRLKPGWTLEMATGELQAISPGIFKATLPPKYPAVSVQNYLGFKLEATPAGTGISQLREAYTQPLWLLLAIAGLVLLIACANLANLMLARASSREREIAIRLALGASRLRLIRQLLTESLLLAAIGAALGVFLAQELSAFLVSYISTQGDPLFVALQTDWRVLGFTVGLSVLTCILFGLMPALRATRIAPVEAMKAGGRAVTASRERFSLRRALVVLQVALSLVRVVGALLFSRSLGKLLTVDPGLRQDGVLVTRLDLSRLKLPAERRLPFKEEMTERLRAIPGVDAAASVNVLPLSGSAWGNNVWLDGADSKQVTNSAFNRVSAGYFQTMEIPLLAGRDFDSRDSVSSPKVAIVSESFARQVTGGTNPVGQRFWVESTPSSPETLYEIVGLVKDTKYQDIHEDFGPVAYFPWAQASRQGLFDQLVLRSNMPMAGLLAAIKRTVGEVSPEIGLNFQVYRSRILESLLRERLMATLAGFFGVLALVLACIGLYGILAYNVAGRTNEIGLRMALGAARRDVIWMVLREALLLTLIGVLIGAPLAVGAGRLVSSLLFGLTPSDPLSIGLAAIVMIAVAALASYIPARRAARVDPMVALRYE